MTDEAGSDFFYDAGSCSLAVRIVLEEVGCAYRAYHPKGRVPALSPVPGRAGGEALLLTEVPAIVTWLARLRPDLERLP